MYETPESDITVVEVSTLYRILREVIVKTIL
jgi:hypothetical protein